MKDYVGVGRKKAQTIVSKVAGGHEGNQSNKVHDFTEVCFLQDGYFPL